jgi:hypothetical protein
VLMQNPDPGHSERGDGRAVSPKSCGAPFDTPDPQDPILCHLPGGHAGPHEGSVSWGPDV